jgi:hypothetical protein
MEITTRPHLQKLTFLAEKSSADADADADADE